MIQLKDKVNDKIAHLDEQQIDELINKYYGDGKAKDLIKEYAIDVSPSKLYTVFPPRKCEDEFCQYCNINLYEARQSKSSYSWNRPEKFCLICGHVLKDFCNCSKCENLRHVKAEQARIEMEQRIIKKRELIYENYNCININHKRWDDLSTTNKIFLGALIKCALSEDLKKIESLYNKKLKLAPSESMEREILQQLYVSDVILVEIGSDIDFFDAAGKIFDFRRASYRINICEEEYQEVISVALSGKYEVNLNECINMWKKIALEEVLEYFLISMDRIKFDFTPGKKTLYIFEHCLEYYSVSQIYGIIYSNIAKAAKYFQEGHVTKRQAANAVITNCKLYFDRSISEDWNLKSYFRDRDCKESALSQYFFGRVTKIGNNGFNVVPNLRTIESYIIKNNLIEKLDNNFSEE